MSIEYYLKIFCCLSSKSCLTLCNPMDCSPTVSSVHGVLQARILEWLVIFFSRESSWPMSWTRVSCIAVRFFTFCTTRKTHFCLTHNLIFQEICFSSWNFGLRLLLFWWFSLSSLKSKNVGLLQNSEDNVFFLYTACWTSG